MSESYASNFSLYLLKDLGLSWITVIYSILVRAAKATLAGFYQIWLGRERNASSEEKGTPKTTPVA